MRVPLGYKFILGFVIVVAVVAFAPPVVTALGYSPGMTQLLTIVVALTVGLIMGWFFSRRFTRNIAMLTESAHEVSQGDLSSDIRLPPTRMPDETHELTSAINLMIQSLRDLVGHIRSSAVKLTGASREINGTAVEISTSTEEVARAIEQISHGAEIQAEQVERSSRIIKETAISIELVASRARESSRTARETTLTARRGSSQASDALILMKDFFVKVEELGTRFEQFNGRLQRVGKVADFIGEVARQTNLLALNASIEAVRAGEYGKGFTVVADEVRKLADSASHSAEEINELIETLRTESQKVHESLLDSSRTIQEGKKNVDITASAFGEIITSVQETERRANSIADLSQMQLEGSGKMVAAIDEIAKVADDNAAATEQVSAATEEQLVAMQDMALATRELTQLADELEQVVRRFNLEEPLELV
ncbi:MAG: methyl-accepting chemotaxis protein, partial [Deltaproteobacteria bacterium]|nr:methyl-accepting chemotaxis protein [Deltaproteobacteria bacterium]